ncbi:DUF551 domain-containing protein [Citrobacter portucalensis]|uniref:DUF551 domain-containing protein n=1 Tax=Citrobacter portucalensis TaxID=1639133 RepID=UPI003AABD151
MTTNNHPAHGPVSLDRLHQISEILSKAAAQSDGGNLGYAMADAVKVIDGVIAAFGAEPVAWIAKKKTTGEMELDEPHAKATNPKYWTDAFPVYTTPQAPVSVPDEMEMDDDFDSAFEHGKAVGWNACRAAMLHTGNSPATPDGWIPVSERMPEVGVKVLCFPVEDEPIHAVFNGQLWLQDISWSVSDEVIDNVISCNVTHWQPLPTAPQQEVKSALEHGMQRYAGAMQKLSEGDD